MLLSVLLLLLLLVVLVSRTQAGLNGFVFTYTAQGPLGNGFYTIEKQKWSFSSCEEVDSMVCGNSCDSLGSLYGKVEESSGEWCQKERVTYGQDGYALAKQYSWSNRSWTDNRNGVVAFRAQALIDPRKRSDTGNVNSSPQTTIIPVVRVPSNCQSDINLLNFDPDGDEVKCRYANGSLSECDACTPPSVLSLSSSCILSFSPTSSSDEGSYAVQMMMEDSPRKTITLTNPDGSQADKTTSDIINSIPVQFVLKVDAAVPSCSEGLYLPRFLPPTPENGAQIIAAVNQTLEIAIRAEATQSVITELLFSGPCDVVKNTSGSGNFTLSWTPNDLDGGQSHPICFIIQANYSSSVYQSALRCVVVTAETSAPVATAPPRAEYPIATAPPIAEYPIATAPPTTDYPTTTTPPTTDYPTTTTPQTTEYPTTTTPPTTDYPTTTTPPTTEYPTTTTPPTTEYPTTTTPQTTEYPTTTAPPKTEYPTTTTPPTTEYPTTTTPPTTEYPTTTAPPTTEYPTTTTPPTTEYPTTTAPPTTEYPTTTTPPTTEYPTTTTPQTTEYPTTTAPPTTEYPTTTTPPTTEYPTTTAPPTTDYPTTTAPPTTEYPTTTTLTTRTIVSPIITTPPTTNIFGPSTTRTTATTTPTVAPTTITTTTTMSPTPAPGQNYVIALKMKISTTLSLDNQKETIVKLIRDALIGQGLPSDISLRLVSSSRSSSPVQVTTAASHGLS
ncbi:mucin-2-like [Nothobranchius furzeri]